MALKDNSQSGLFRFDTSPILSIFEFLRPLLRILFPLHLQNYRLDPSTVKCEPCPNVPPPPLSFLYVPSLYLLHQPSAYTLLASRRRGRRCWTTILPTIHILLIIAIPYFPIIFIRR